MLSFSQRQGLKQIRQIMQIDDMDEDLRISLWNCLTVFYWNGRMIKEVRGYSIEPHIFHLFQNLQIHYFKKPVDTLDARTDLDFIRIRDYFFNCSWNEVYDFIEFVANNYKNGQNDCNESFMAVCNGIFETEMSAYRFINGTIAPITSELEIKEIEKGMEQSDQFHTVSTHLDTALRLMSDKINPDYRNSIKESICAVEAACAIISGDNKATLGKALKIIELEHSLHGSLKGAFEKLYGYTSDADGIRHALLEEPTLDFNDAKFMLVSCSAFVNYLIGKIAKKG